MTVAVAHALIDRVIVPLTDAVGERRATVGLMVADVDADADGRGDVL